jgi:trans-2,3-dihydro-3-hydroxyanthranilate isomerase
VDRHRFEQLLIRLSSRAAVLAAQPEPVRFKRDALLRPGRSVAYIWYVEHDVATVRMFTERHGAVIEDPGTGSACANLGGWCALNALAPLAWRIEQGEAIDRPNVLYLTVDATGRIGVGGRVIDVADGLFHLPAESSEEE